MDHPKPSHLQRLLKARAEHAGRLGAGHGLLPSTELERLDDMSEAELEDLELAALELDEHGQVLRANRALSLIHI